MNHMFVRGLVRISYEKIEEKCILFLVLKKPLKADIRYQHHTN